MHPKNFATQTAHPQATPLAERFMQVQAQTTALAAPLSAEDCQVQSMPDASPTKWHLAHTAWFFETFVLERFDPCFTPFDSGFKVLFNSYYNGVGDKHPRAERGLVTRPTLATVMAYRAAVQERLLNLLHSQPDNAELLDLVLLGTHHEQQHQELLLTDIKHALWRNPAMPAYAERWPMVLVKPQALAWLGYEGGLQAVGFNPTTDGVFSFDNEAPQHSCHLRPYALATRPTTYGDFLVFMADGGYTRPELWLSMGWEWVISQQVSAPLYWHQMDGQWHNFTLQGLVPVDPNTPLPHLSYLEADAYARWAGARLPTEAEWEHAARINAPAGTASSISGNLLEGRAFHTLPHSGVTREPMQQLYGDVWEWTQSSYSAYPGYSAVPGAVGEYNGKFMCNQYVLRGGSCVTPHSHLRASYRNFFPPQAQWQFSGLRLARDL